MLAVVEAVFKVQRDFGNREDRKLARLKYVIANWGLEKFKAKVEEYYGSSLPDPHPADVEGFNDHMGWDEQGDGRWFYGLNIENVIRFEVGYDQALVTNAQQGYKNTYFSGAGFATSFNGPWDSTRIRAEIGYPVVAHGVQGFTMNVQFLKVF